MKAACTTRVSLVVIGILLGCSMAFAQDVTIVANVGVSVSSISNSQLRDIFTGASSRFADGSHAVPVLLKGGAAHEVLLRRHIGDDPAQFRIRWHKALFTGQGSMPKEFASEAALLEFVAATPGAIGYVSRVPDPNLVKILNVSDR